MKHYEIMIHNGSYPLIYKCSTIAEAYGCLLEVVSWAPHVRIDRDSLMEVLVNMKSGNLLAHESRGFSIAVREGEV